MRYAFVWVEVVPELFDSKPPSGPAGRLGSDVGYYEAFGAPRATIPGATLPWIPVGRNLYWTRFLAGANPNTIEPPNAWEHLVPIRLALKPSPSDEQGMFVISTECFLFPFGLGLVVSVNRRADESLADAVDAAISFRRGARIALPSSARGPVPLDAAAERILGSVRQRLYGLPPANSPPVEPFTIATVVQGSGYDPDTGPIPEVRQALTGLVFWDPEWRSKPVTEGATSDVPLSRKRSRPGHVMIAADRGRAVWFPARFGATQKTRTLGCYHRNLVLASTQTEALGTFMSSTLDRLGNADPSSLPWDEHSTWERAVRILDASYVGLSSTYRSASIQRQITDGLKTDLDLALAMLGEAGLPKPATGTATVVP